MSTIEFKCTDPPELKTISCKKFKANFDNAIYTKMVFHMNVTLQEEWSFFGYLHHVKELYDLHVKYYPKCYNFTPEQCEAFQLYRVQHEDAYRGLAIQLFNDEIVEDWLSATWAHLDDRYKDTLSKLTQLEFGYFKHRRGGIDVSLPEHSTCGLILQIIKLRWFITAYIEFHELELLKMEHKRCTTPLFTIPIDIEQEGEGKGEEKMSDDVDDELYMKEISHLKDLSNEFFDSVFN